MENRDLEHAAAHILEETEIAEQRQDVLELVGTEIDDRHLAGPQAGEDLDLVVGFADVDDGRAIRMKALEDAVRMLAVESAVFHMLRTLVEIAQRQARQRGFANAALCGADDYDMGRREIGRHCRVPPM